MIQLENEDRLAFTATSSDSCAGFRKFTPDYMGFRRNIGTVLKTEELLRC